MQDSELRDEDTCVERMMKKTCDFNVRYNPLLLGVVLALVAGQSYAFVFIMYVLGLACCIVFNVFKVHRGWVETMVGRWMVEALFPLCVVLTTVNLVVGEHSTILYTLRQA